MDAEVSADGNVTAHSRLVDPGKPEERLAAFLAPLDAQNAVFLDQPLGAVSYTHLDVYKRQPLIWVKGFWNT